MSMSPEARLWCQREDERYLLQLDEHIKYINGRLVLRVLEDSPMKYKLLEYIELLQDEKNSYKGVKSGNKTGNCIFRHMVKEEPSEDRSPRAPDP